MKILLYLLVPIAIVVLFAVVTWARNRQPTSLESGVDAFRREMTALSPDAAPVHRRRGEGSEAGDASAGSPPRRPPTTERED